MKFEISKETNNVLRGVAILAIVMHNFCGWAGVSENEFRFAASNITDLWTSISSGALNAVWDIIAFFGHYGVEIFVFLSGYGLAKKHAGAIPRFGAYMRHNISKLWLLMIPGLLCYAVLTLIFFARFRLYCPSVILHNNVSLPFHRFAFQQHSLWTLLVFRADVATLHILLCVGSPTQKQHAAFLVCGGSRGAVSSHRHIGR